MNFPRTPVVGFEMKFFIVSVVVLFICTDHTGRYVFDSAPHEIQRNHFGRHSENLDNGRERTADPRDVFDRNSESLGRGGGVWSLGL